MARTPFEREQGNERTGTLADNTNYETTIGGPIVRDRLWFFYANRVQREEDEETFDETGIGYTDKLTGTIAPGHTLTGSYVRNSTSDTRPSFSFSIDPATIRSRRLPNDLWVATYRGAATSSLFIEGQVSRKRLGFRGSGGTSRDILDSPIFPLTQGFFHYNAPFFDATDPQDRDNLQFTGSATYYLPTELGSHSIKGGTEHFKSTLTGANSPTATGFIFDADWAVASDGTPLLDANGRLVPVFAPFENLIEAYAGVSGASLDINTLSFYVNDEWKLSDHLTLNLGVRTETVDSETTGNIVAVDHSTVVPRIGLAYDPLGDGRYTFQSTYSHYAGKYNEAQFSRNSNVGSTELLLGVYTGPPGQGLDFAPGFDPDNYFTVFGEFPTGNIIFEDDLHSPITKEFTVSGGGKLGPNGYAKVTYINRRADDFVEDFTDLTTGSTEIIRDGQSFGDFSNKVFRNTGLLARDYDAIEVQARYQVTDNFLIDGSYTAQLKNEGNFEGELANQPAMPSNAFDYPEITPEARYFPTGRLDEFQRHKLRIWGIYNLALGDCGNLDIGGIWRVNSGRTYSLRSSNIGSSDTQDDILSQLGYVDGPETLGRNIYYSAGRGSESFKGYGLFDLSVNYDIPVWESVRPWVQAEVYNLLNNDKQLSFNTTVRPDSSGPVDELGIPTTFTEGSRFGEATSPDDFPQYLPGLDGLRAFLLTFGLSF